MSTWFIFLSLYKTKSPFGFFRVFSGFRVGAVRVRVFSGSGSGRVGLRFRTRLRPLIGSELKRTELVFVPLMLNVNLFFGYSHQKSKLGTGGEAVRNLGIQLK